MPHFKNLTAYYLLHFMDISLITETVLLDPYLVSMAAVGWKVVHQQAGEPPPTAPPCSSPVVRSDLSVSTPL